MEYTLNTSKTYIQKSLYNTFEKIWIFVHILLLRKYNYMKAKFFMFTDIFKKNCHTCFLVLYYDVSIQIKLLLRINKTV